MCPNDAIKMRKTSNQYIPSLKKAKCTDCGICLKVCPACSVDFEKLNNATFGAKSRSAIGNYINCYIGHSNDENLRCNSSSGGLVTQLLIFALDEGVIDGALVTRMNMNRPLEPEVFIARTKNEIIDASRSKYCPVPVNMGAKQLLKETGRFAVVGLPCHIEGLRKAEAVSVELRKKIVLHIGLICNHTPTFQATTYLLKKMRVNEDNIIKIDYRGGGWPGFLSVKLKNGQTRVVRHFDPYYWGHVFGSYFIPTRCSLCNDKVCQLSDISFGDAWGKSKSKLGESIVISRSQLGNGLLLEAEAKGQIKLALTKSNDVIYSQGLDFVKRRYNAHNQVFRKLGKRVPDFNQNPSRSEIPDYVMALISYLQSWVSLRPHLWPLLDIYPFIVDHVKGKKKFL